MCGIAALVSASPLAASDIVAMCDRVRHRGPDDEGYALFDGEGLAARAYGGPDTPPECYRAASPFAPRAPLGGAGAFRAALGHRRLSIVDLTPSGHQPMCGADERCWIVYNGEIYNHIELREELRRAGHEFSGGSDTEVILAAYREWGSDCLRRFNGMFAFALLDRGAGRLFCARDRFGVKPLYYSVVDDGTIAFASEIKQFGALAGWRAVANGQRAYDFLAWGLLDHTPQTLFAGVFQLGPGESLELDLGSLGRHRKSALLPTRRWYELAPAPFSGSETDAALRFRELFTDAVRLRLRADVPVGSCLSGGLDSSSIVCIANRLLREKDAHSLQETFSAVADVARFDESAYMEEVVRATGVRHRTTLPRLEALFDELPAITWHLDEPFGSTSIYAQWNVFRLAAEHGVKVMLDGQGADEALAGYHGFFRPHFANLFLRLRWPTLAGEVAAARRQHGYPAMWALKLLADGVLPEPLKMPLRRIAAQAHAEPDWLDLAALRATPGSPAAALRTRPRSVSDESYQQLTATNLQMLLHWEDRDSMAHSIESRVPFLDYRLVELVLGLPDRYKLWQGTTKRVLRDAMKDVLPERVRTRRDKIGFATPEEVWVRERQPDVFRKRLRLAVDQSRGVLRGPAAQNFLERLIRGERTFDFTAWRMISFGAWVERFDVQL